MKLYHGTTAENYEAIIAAGIIHGPVYMTADRNIAEEYAGDGEVVEVYVDASSLLIDLDMPGGKLIDADTASEYLGLDEVRDAEWFAENGYSVGVMCSVEV